MRPVSTCCRCPSPREITTQYGPGWRVGAARKTRPLFTRKKWVYDSEKSSVPYEFIFTKLLLQKNRSGQKIELQNRLVDEPCKIGWEFFHAVAVPPARWLGSKSREVKISAISRAPSSRRDSHGRCCGIVRTAYVRRGLGTWRRSRRAPRPPGLNSRVRLRVARWSKARS